MQNNVLSFFGPTPTRRLKFQNRETMIAGFAVLDELMISIEAFGDYTFGPVSEDVVRELRQRNILFEVVKNH